MTKRNTFNNRDIGIRKNWQLREFGAHALTIFASKRNIAICCGFAHFIFEVCRSLKETLLKYTLIIYGFVVLRFAAILHNHTHNYMSLLFLFLKRAHKIDQRPTSILYLLVHFIRVYHDRQISVICTELWYLPLCPARRSNERRKI